MLAPSSPTTPSDEDGPRGLGQGKQGKAPVETPLRPARRSRNSIFTDSWAVSSPTSSPVSASRSSSPLHLPLPPGGPTSRRPSLPSVRIESPPQAYKRPSLEAIGSPQSPRVAAWESVLPVELTLPPTPALALRHIPTRPYLLGVGRHASVFVAACRSIDSVDPAAASATGWRLCAAKRMNADRESQVGGFREAYILSKLYDGGRGPPSIVRLLAVKDEQTSEATSTTPSQRHLIRPPRSSDHTRSASAQEVGKLTIDTGHTLHRAASVEMTKSGSHSTPNSPVASVDPVTPQGSLLAAPAASVRRSISLRESSGRLSWVSNVSNGEDIDPPRLVLVLELCPEGNLATLLQKRPELAGRRLWLKWSKALATAVAHAHTMGFMHADIKPGNCMLTETLDVRLADWGMSLPIHADRLPTEGLGLGTTLYCAPELVQAPPCPFSFPADVYALGVTLHVLITGREPYRDVRTPVEQMLWVGRGAYWDYEERQRLGAIGHRSGSGSVHSGLDNGLGTSLSSYGGSRPPSRVGSIRSLRSLALEQGTPPDQQADLTELFGDDASTEILGQARQALGNAAVGSTYDDVPDLVDGAGSMAGSNETAEAYPRTYSDGTPLQYFLDGREPVPEGVRLLLKRMTAPNPADRPSATEVVNGLAVF